MKISVWFAHSPGSMHTSLGNPLSTKIRFFSLPWLAIYSSHHQSLPPIARTAPSVHGTYSWSSFFENSLSPGLCSDCSLCLEHLVFHYNLSKFYSSIEAHLSLHLLCEIITISTNIFLTSYYMLDNVVSHLTFTTIPGDGCYYETARRPHS